MVDEPEQMEGAKISADLPKQAETVQAFKDLKMPEPGDLAAEGEKSSDGEQEEAAPGDQADALAPEDATGSADAAKDFLTRPKESTPRSMVEPPIKDLPEGFGEQGGSGTEGSGGGAPSGE